MLRRSSPLFLLLLLVALAGCAGRGGGGSGDDGVGPAIGVKGDDDAAAEDLGFPAFATKNTTRVAGSDPVALAAGVARAVFPGSVPGQRPGAVTLVPRDDWRVAVAAASLMAEPVRAPLLFAERGEIPTATADTLEQLAPTGSEEAGDAQVVRIGEVPAPKGLRTTDVRADNPFAMARAIDAFGAAAAGAPSDQVLIVAADAPAFAMPAAAWAAKSGDPVLFVERNRVPEETIAALRSHRQPRIYVLGPSSVISPAVTKRLRKLGTVARVGGQTPEANAIAFARYVDGTFGWGVVDPGHGLVFAAGEDPLVAAAASPLSASGTYGPLLLLGEGGKIGRELRGYLLDIQPGYQRDPVRGVYNRGWILGDAGSVPLATQALVDELLEIRKVTTDAPGEGETPPATTPPAPAQTTPTTPTTPTPTPLTTTPDSP